MVSDTVTTLHSQVAQRFFNSHAIANGAVSFRRAGDGKLADVRVVIGHFDTPEVGAETLAFFQLPCCCVLTSVAVQMHKDLGL